MASAKNSCSRYCTLMVLESEIELSLRILLDARLAHGFNSA